MKFLLKRNSEVLLFTQIKKTEFTDMSKDWSDHALWWPEKRRWLTHTRSTLDQIGITANCNLEFTPQHKLAMFVFV